MIRDILHRLADRITRHVLLWPVAVQGEAAAQQIAAAIEGFNRLDMGGEVPRPDVLIVGRGGGSLEDLWAFNEEVVVRAAAGSAIPLISAVGHETDTTLIDFASDMRAPTPTAAAEMAVPVRAELLAQVLDDEKRIVGAVDRLLGERRTHLEGLARGLPEPVRLLENAAQRLDDWSDRLRNGLINRLERSRQILARLLAGLSPAALGREIAGAADRLAGTGERLRPAAARLLERRGEQLESLGLRLESVSYNKVLERGFALVRGGDGRPVARAATLEPGEDIAIRFHDGELPARVSGKPVRKPSAKTASASARKKPARRDRRQGELL